MSDISRKPARSRHPLVPDNAPEQAPTTENDAERAGVLPVDPYADPMYDTLVNLQVRVPLRVKMRLDELKKRDGGSIAGHVSEGLTQWLSSKGL